MLRGEVNHLPVHLKSSFSSGGVQVPTSSYADQEVGFRVDVRLYSTHAFKTRAWEVLMTCRKPVGR